MFPFTVVLLPLGAGLSLSEVDPEYLRALWQYPKAIGLFPLAIMPHDPLPHPQECVAMGTFPGGVWGAQIRVARGSSFLHTNREAPEPLGTQALTELVEQSGFEPPTSGLQRLRWGVYIVTIRAGPETAHKTVFVLNR